MQIVSVKVRKQCLEINKMFWKWGISLLALVLAGCGQQTLYTNLPEKEVNEMVAILLSNHVTCDKVSGSEGLWNMIVSKDEFSEAVLLLNEAGYPRDSFSSLGEAFKKSGLVSSPLEERIRFMYALSEELSETITHIHGVVTARVHIVLPDNDPYTEKITPSSASVFISYLPQINLEDCVRDIRQLITNSIEGLAYDKVNVSLFPASNPNERLPLSSIRTEAPFKTICGVSVRNSSVSSFIFMLIGVLAIGLAVGMLIPRFLKKEKKQEPSVEAE